MPDLQSVETAAKAEVQKAKTWFGATGKNWLAFAIGCACGLLVSWIAKHL